MARNARPTPGNDTQTIARNIRAEIGAQQISRRELAERTEGGSHPISYPQISRYALGERSPDIDELRSISNALGVPIAGLLNGVL